MAKGLTVHTAQNLEELTYVMAEILSQPTSSILEPTWTVVPSAPIRQWLDWHLSHRVGTSSDERRDGVTANLKYLFPEEFVRVLESFTLSARDIQREEWDAQRFTLALLSQSAERSFSDARRMGQQIDTLLRWRSDYFKRPSVAPEASHASLLAYSALLDGVSGPLAQRDCVMEILRGAQEFELPERIVLFGVATVPGGPAFTEFVQAISLHCEIHVLLPVGAAELFSNLKTSPEISTQNVVRPLSTWHNEGRETLHMWRHVAPHESQWINFHRADEETVSVLSTLQNQLRGRPTNRVAWDRSVQVLGCVGKARQAEVLRDIIFDANVVDGIQPHEILVVTTDPAQFLAALERHWHYEDETGSPRLPRLFFEMSEADSVNDGDRTSCASALLSLLGNYVTVEQFQRFCTMKGVRQGIDLPNESWQRWWTLVQAAPVTFGVSTTQRTDRQVYGDKRSPSASQFDAGTWQRLLDRVVDGFVEPSTIDSHHLGVPSDVEIAAAFGPLLRLLDVSASSLNTERLAVSSWIARLETWTSIAAPSDGIDQSFDLTCEKARSHLQPISTSLHNFDPTLSFQEFRNWWNELISNTTRQKVFGRGGVTVTRLTAMPYAPYRMICVLGLDEESLPAAVLTDPLLGARREGDPDARQAVMSALLAVCLSARDRLVVTFDARNEETGQPRDPAIALDDLLDVIGRSTTKARHEIVVETPRHGFYVSANASPDVTSSFDYRYGQLHSAASKSSPRMDLANRLHTLEISSVPIQALREFALSPANFILRYGVLQGRGYLPRYLQKALGIS